MVRRKMLIAGLFAALLCTSSSMAQELQRNEVSAQGTGFFTKDSEEKGIKQRTTDSGGLPVSYRYNFNRWLAAEGSYGYTRNTQKANATEEYTETASSIYERVAPAVVLIHAISINPYRITERVEHSVGSGFIIDPAGLVVTNSHVAFGRQSLVVKLNDGTDLPAQLIGADPIFDIAILRIPKLKQNALTAVKLGDSQCVQVGEDVLGMGSPLGLV